MRRLIGTNLALLMVVALATMASAQNTPAAPTGAQIVPGQSIGQFHLGQDMSGIVAALGPLHSQDDVPGTTLTGYYWPLKRIGAIADNTTNKIVALVVSLDETYQTGKGVAAGTEMDAIRSAYGPEDSVDSHSDDDTLVYDKLGVAFVVDKSGALGSRVSVIFVFGPGHYHDIFKNATQ